MSRSSLNKQAGGPRHNQLAHGVQVPALKIAGKGLSRPPALVGMVEPLASGKFAGAAAHQLPGSQDIELREGEPDANVTLLTDVVGKNSVTLNFGTGGGNVILQIGPQ